MGGQVEAEVSEAKTFFGSEVEGTSGFEPHRCTIKREALSWPGKVNDPPFHIIRSSRVLRGYSCI